MSFLMNEWILIPLIAICVFIIFFTFFDRVYSFLKEKTLGQREQVFKMLELMFIEVDQKRITWIMILLSFGLGTVVFFLFFPNVITGLIFGSIITVLGWSLPMLLIRNMYDSRCTRFVDQMVDGLTMMSNGIKSGLSVNQSMERVVENMKNPMSQEFALVLSQTRIGRTLEDSLIDLSVRIPKPDVLMFVTSVNILKETGGNLAETFTTIVNVVRERQKIEKKIQAMTAQGMMQGLIISLVPFFLFALFFFIDPKMVMPMLTTTLGLVLLFIMIIPQIIGGIVIRKIVKIEV
jgi:tight adherence protein B